MAAELTPEEVAQLDKLAGEGGKQCRFIKPAWGRKVRALPTFQHFVGGSHAGVGLGRI